jgi:hypothetical protein
VAEYDWIMMVTTRYNILNLSYPAMACHGTLGQNTSKSERCELLTTRRVASKSNSVTDKEKDDGVGVAAADDDDEDDVEKGVDDDMSVDVDDVGDGNCNDEGEDDDDSERMRK